MRPNRDTSFHHYAIRLGNKVAALKTTANKIISAVKVQTITL